jgi:leucyl-tRNA synthetase
LSIQQVVQVGEHLFDATHWHDWYADKLNGHLINSDQFTGLPSKRAMTEIGQTLEDQGVGKRQTTWRLRDWGISRQRYWGTPIPIIHCKDCGAVPVPEKDLPVVLPDDLIPDGTGNPLTKHTAFLNCACPKCGKPAKRETDTMDTFVDSSWYFMRYTSPGNDLAMVDSRNDYWMPMDQYIGGIEHAVLHLLYARFWTKVMRDMGLVKFDEPFTRLLCQGMVLNHIYYERNEKGGMEYHWPEDVENIYDERSAIVGAKHRQDGRAIVYGGMGTMSKSKNNGVDPQALIERQGADTARLFVMFTSPPEQTLEWSDSGIDGSMRFIKRVWSQAYNQRSIIQLQLQSLQKPDWKQASAGVKQLRFDMYTLLKQADFDYERMQYNTVVSACMKMLNTIESAKLENDPNQGAVITEAISILIRVLYPVVPHLTWTLWNELGFAEQSGDLLDTAWPTVDVSALETDEVEYVLQINGKLRGSLRVASAASKEDIVQTAQQHEAVTKFLAGQVPKRVIVVPGKLVNVVG